MIEVNYNNPVVNIVAILIQAFNLLKIVACFISTLYTSLK